MLTRIITFVIAVFISYSAVSQSIDVDASSIVWNASKVTGKHTGIIKLSKGSLDYKGSKLTGGEFTIDMTTINTTDLEGEWKQKLDGHLKSDDFFGVEKFNTSTFKIKKVKSKGNNAYDVSGNITIKGTTEVITFPATVSGNEVTAKITLDRTKFDIRYGSNSFFDNLGDKAIHDEFTLDVKLVTK